MSSGPQQQGPGLNFYKIIKFVKKHLTALASGGIISLALDMRLYKRIRCESASNHVLEQLKSGKEQW